MSPSICITGMQVSAITVELNCSHCTACSRSDHLVSDRTAQRIRESSTTAKYSTSWRGWGLLFLLDCVKHITLLGSSNDDEVIEIEGDPYALVV